MVIMKTEIKVQRGKTAWNQKTGGGNGEERTGPRVRRPESEDQQHELGQVTLKEKD